MLGCGRTSRTGARRCSTSSSPRRRRRSATRTGVCAGAIEYSQWYRKAKTAESRFQRAYLDRSRLTVDALCPGPRSGEGGVKIVVEVHLAVLSWRRIPLRRSLRISEVDEDDLTNLISAIEFVGTVFGGTIVSAS